MDDLLYLPARKTVHVLPDLTQNPVRIELPRNRKPARTVLALLSIWGAVGTVALFHGLAKWSQQMNNGLLISWVITLLVTLVAIWIGVLAMRQYVSPDTIVLHDDHLDLTRWSLWHKHEEHLALADFSHLAARSQQSGEGERRHLYQIIELVHKDGQTRLPLYIEKTPHPPQQWLQALSERLHVPARR